MSVGHYTLAAAAIAKDKQYVALLNKLEIKENAEADTSQWQALGRLLSGSTKITIAPVSVDSQGKIPNQLGFTVAIEASLLASSKALIASLTQVITEATAMRFTDVNGLIWTFNTTATDPEIDVTVGLTIEGDAENAVVIPITAAGYLTKAKMITIFGT